MVARRIKHTTGRVRTGKPLPRCETCGKAQYRTKYAAGLDADRFRMTIYECDGGGIHLTSKATRVYPALPKPYRRKPVDTLSSCPACGLVNPKPVEGMRPCPHPCHSPGRMTADQPYYPELRVSVAGGANIFAALGEVQRVLRRAKVPEATVQAFALDFRAAPDYEAALACVRRWVQVA